MADNNRRYFLKQAFATGGSLFVAGSIGSSLHAQPEGPLVYGETVNPNRLLPGAQPRFSMRAILATVQGDTLSVVPGGKPVTIYPANDLVVWKGTESRDFLSLSRSDVLYLTGIIDPSGKLMATRIWSNIVNISGTVLNVVTDGYLTSVRQKTQLNPSCPSHPGCPNKMAPGHDNRRRSLKYGRHNKRNVDTDYWLADA